MRLTESIENKLATVYHSSGDVHCFEYILNHDWRDGDEGQAYGSGLYTCWSIASTFEGKDSLGNSIMPKEHYINKDVNRGRAYMDENGVYICFRFEFLVDLTNYFFFPEPKSLEKSKVVFEKYKLVHPESTATVETFVKEQNERFGLDYKDIGDAIFDRKRHNSKIDGIVFMGSHDGDVVVVYNTDMAIPTRFSKGNKDEWFPINNDPTYAETAKLTALGINPPATFWNKFVLSDEAKQFMNELGDANQTKYLINGGNKLQFEDSIEEEIETPDDYVDYTNLKSIELKNCLELKRLNIKISNLVSPNKFELKCLNVNIENEADSDLVDFCINGDIVKKLDISESNTFVINRCPNLSFDEIKAKGDNSADSLFKLRLTTCKVLNVSEYENVKFINAKIDDLFVGSCNTILIKNMHLKRLVVSEKVEAINLKNSTIDNVVYQHPKYKGCINLDETSSVNE